MKKIMTITLLLLSVFCMAQTKSSVTVNKNSSENPTAEVIPKANGGTDVIINQPNSNRLKSKSNNPYDKVKMKNPVGHSDDPRKNVKMKHPVGHSNNPRKNVKMGKPKNSSSKKESKVIKQ